MTQQNDQGPTPESYSIVGAWRVETEGAPFVAHVALFHADGTMLIHNPDAGNRHTSDSLGVGAWRQDQQHAQTILGVFEEINADRATGAYISRLRVTYRLSLNGAAAFTGRAEASYYAPGGTELHDQAHQAQLSGARIQP
jgi:hypothetical protein